MKGVVYNYCRLMPGSKAFELHEAKKFKELDAHEKQLSLEADKRGDVPLFKGKPNGIA